MFLRVRRGVGKVRTHTAMRGPCRSAGPKFVAVSFTLDSLLQARILVIRSGSNNANDYGRAPDYGVAGQPSINVSQRVPDQLLTPLHVMHL